MGLRKGDIIELKIESLAYGGKGISHIDNMAVFVESAIPGQTVKALIRKKKSSYAEAVAKEVLIPSPDEVTPLCPYFGECGGCKLQNMPYEQQLFYKAEQVRDIYQHSGNIRDANIREILASGEVFRYRNKVEFTFGTRRWIYKDNDPPKPKDFALGFHKPRIYDKVLDIDECYLQPEIGDRILQVVRDFALKERLKPWDTRTSTGFLRHLVIRHSPHTRQTMVNIVTGYENPEFLLPLSEILRNLDPNIYSVVNNINTRKATIAVGEKEVLLSGKPYIEDLIGSLKFRISANSFFQTNTFQAENLYNIVKEASDPDLNSIVWDLYCGAGSIALFIADSFKQVIGLELIESAIADAKINARNNKIENTNFFTFDLNKIHSPLYQNIKEKLPNPDVIILDPPRSGAHPKLMKFISELDCPLIIYVSCNPATQVRDIKPLLSNGWKIDFVQPVDMFPHTSHIECVTRLVK